MNLHTQLSIVLPLQSHFVPPWAYGNDGMDLAVEELITVATGAP